MSGSKLIIPTTIPNFTVDRNVFAPPPLRNVRPDAREFPPSLSVTASFSSSFSAASSIYYYHYYFLPLPSRASMPENTNRSAARKSCQNSKVRAVRGILSRFTPEGGKRRWQFKRSAPRGKIERNCALYRFLSFSSRWLNIFAWEIVSFPSPLYYNPRNEFNTTRRRYTRKSTRQNSLFGHGQMNSSIDWTNFDWKILVNEIKKMCCNWATVRLLFYWSILLMY